MSRPRNSQSRTYDPTPSTCSSSGPGTLRDSETRAQCPSLCGHKVQQSGLGWTAGVDFFPLSSMCLLPPLDISPTAQGVDHRRVQKELGDVVVNMHNPVVLSSTSVQVTWTVSRSQTDRAEVNFSGLNLLVKAQRVSESEQLVLHQFWIICADGKSRVMFLFCTNESPLGDTCVTSGGSL